jgi:8-oxo-dGTP diphosphatase
MPWMTDDFQSDFLGAFAVVQRGERILMVQNERRIGGVSVATWDLPGGRVEPAEMLHEALRREMHEETGLSVVNEPTFLFVQEGERRRCGKRVHAWRSFFFAIDALGEPVASNEVLRVGWFTRRELVKELTAPYHDSFRAWLEQGGTLFRSDWSD